MVCACTNHRPVLSCSFFSPTPTGTVKQAFKIVRGKPRSEWPLYAIKQIDQVHRSLVEREERVMLDLCDHLNDHTTARVQQHPGLIQLIAPLFASRSSVHLALEFAQGGDLHSQVLYSTKRLSSHMVGFLTLEMLAGLQWIHHKGYVYSDLKPENVLIMGNGHLKLCDFGASRKMDNIERGGALEGTAMYMAPELLQGDGQLTAAADLWSLGCILYEIW